MKQPRIAIIGDRFRDVLTFVKPLKFCPDAPVPVYKTLGAMETRGGAAAVADCCRALGADITRAIWGAAGLKNRIIAESDDMRQQLLLRIDEDSVYSGNPGGMISSLNPDNCDLILVSDYGKGVISTAAMDAVRKTGVPFIVDPCCQNSGLTNGALAVTPNRSLELFPWPNVRYIIQKMDRDGCYFGDQHFPATQKHIVDPAGAGDQFLATLGVDARGSGITTAIEFANIAAGLQCLDWGTVPVTAAGLYV